MNVLVYFLGALSAFGLAFRFYGRFIARSFGEDKTRPTPAAIMAVTTVVALSYKLVVGSVPARNYLLTVTDIILLFLALGVVRLAVKKLIHPVQGAEITNPS